MRNVGTGIPVELLPGIYEVRASSDSPTEKYFAWISAFILTDPRGKEPVAVVDSGWPQTPRTLLIPALASLGFDPSRVATLVNTHSHPDHIQGNTALRALTGCQIWISDADAQGLQASGENYGQAFHAHEPDRHLHSHETVDLAGRQWEVIPLPGHSAGSIGLFNHHERILICGDALQAESHDVAGLAMLPDRQAYRAMLDRVANLGVRHLIPSHPFEPLRSTHLTPETEVTRYLDSCRRNVDEFEMQVHAALHALGGSASTTALAERLCLDRGIGRPCPLAGFALSIDRSHLERVGTIRSGDPGDVWHLA